MPETARDHLPGLCIAALLVSLVACGGNGNNGGSGDDECESRGCKLTASDAAREDRFGASVAVSGEVAVIGAVLDNDGGTDSGSAYVFRSEGGDWREEQKLTASDAEEVDMFGASIATADGVIVVGAPGNSAAYVFGFDGTQWVEEQVLTPVGAGLLFGTSVAISDDALVVGAPGSDAIFVYRFDGTAWLLEERVAILVSPFIPAANLLFGESVGISDDAIVVGTPRSDNGNLGAGFVLVYRFDGTTWLFEESVFGADEFGTEVAILDDVLVVGESDDNDLVEDEPGSVFVYRFDGTNWLEEQELQASNATPGVGDVFGISVAVSDGVIIAGSRRNDAAPPSSGSAYVFAFDGMSWVEDQILTSPTAAPLDIFGNSVGISGDVIVVGSSFDDASNSAQNTGATYVFRL